MALPPHAQPRIALTARLRGIYAIVDDRCGDVQALAEAALDGGVRILQLRAKAGIDPDDARAIRRITHERGALFLLNDDWRAVERYDADGAHLGPDDAGPAELTSIRAALAGRVLGLSCGTLEELRMAEAAGADYAGVGSVYATGSKADAGEPIGVDGLGRIAAAAAIPVAAIGGITLERIPAVAAAGASMAAVISAIAAAPNPSAAAAALVAAWE